jgi:peptidoglycan/xylan/chitin deacetylase (PgdA/CDA1 family)
MLAGHGLAGTFYVPIEPFRAGSELSVKEIRDLAAGSFEIGGHTVSHRGLTELTGEDQAREVSECKRILEDRLGAEVKSFCYPNGQLNRETVRSVEQAGYQGARTTRMLRSSIKFPRFEMPTTLQAYPHPAQAYLRNTIKGGNLGGLAGFALHLRRARTWVELGKMLFDQVLEDGGFWHLYGHSWELDELGLWDQLEELLGYVAQRRNVQYVTNAGVYQVLGIALSAGSRT